MLTVCCDSKRIRTQNRKATENIYKTHIVTHINSCVKYGGLGLREIYWAYRTQLLLVVSHAFPEVCSMAFK